MKIVTVYVVYGKHWGKKWQVKIGATEDLKGRLYSLFQNDKYKLIHAIQAPPFLERILHKVAKPFNVGGHNNEWFRVDCLPKVKEIVDIYEKYKNRDQRGRKI